MQKTVLCLLLWIGSITTMSQQNNFSKVLEFYHKEKKFNGVALVATNKKLDYLGAFGTANRQFNIAMQTKTKFKIASITKTFTAVLIMQLYQEGKLKLNDTIGKYLTRYKGDARNKVTINQLLTYSSGIPNCEGNTGIEVYQKHITVDQFIDSYCSGALEFEPGKQFNYNNADYILLGKIVEKITGKPFAQNLKEKILHPLNLQNTGMLKSQDIVKDLASTYNLDDSTKSFLVDDPMYIESYYAAGAMYSTIEDLWKFSNGIFTYKLLNKKTVDLMLTPYPELWGVAYGFWVTDSKFGNITTKAANRQGSIWGANANWLYLIDKQKTILVLSNTNATNLVELTEQLVLATTNQKPTIPAAAQK